MTNKKILIDAIALEIYGKKYYSNLSELISDNNAKSILRGLAMDEEKHRELLEKEYNRVIKEDLDIKAIEESIKKANTINTIFKLHDSISDTKEALKLGISIEERSIEYYSNAAKTDKSKDLFLKLKKMEEGHKAILEDALYYLEQEGTWYGYSPPTLEG